MADIFSKKKTIKKESSLNQKNKNKKKNFSAISKFVNFEEDNETNKKEQDFRSKMEVLFLLSFNFANQFRAIV